MFDDSLTICFDAINLNNSLKTETFSIFLPPSLVRPQRFFFFFLLFIQTAWSKCIPQPSSYYADLGWHSRGNVGEVTRHFRGCGYSQPAATCSRCPVFPITPCQPLAPLALLSSRRQPRPCLSIPEYQRIPAPLRLTLMLPTRIPHTSF